MKAIKYAGIFLLAVLVIYLLLCVAGPKNLDVSESKEIEAPPLVVFNLVNDLKNGELWDYWTLNDTTMKITYNGIEEGVGATSSWTSENSGNGRQQIIESSQPNLIKSQLTFEGWEGVNHATFNIAPTPKGCTAIWSFESGAPFPFLTRGTYLLMGMKRHMKRAFRKGLENIATLAVERIKEGKYLGYTIQEKLLDERHFIMRRNEVRIANMQQYYATHLGSLFQLAQRSNIEMTGMPCGLFFAVDEKNQTADMAAAIPVSEPVNIENAASYTLEAKKALETDYFGPYSGLGTVHRAMENYMKDRKYLFDPPFVEEYVTDPGVEEDPNKIQTRVTYYYTE